MLSRSLLALLLMVSPADALVLGHGGGLSAMGGTAVLTKTLENLSASTTPTVAGTTMIPTQFGIAFPPSGPDQVPSGNIVIPSVGGVTLTNANVDYQQCSFWADGSLRFCPFSGFVPQLAGVATEQVTFTQTSGSWPTASSVVPSSISSATDIKEVLSNVNNSFAVQSPSQYGVDWGIEPGFYVSGGSISGGVIRNPPGGVGLLGYNCSNTGPCITPANYQTSTNATITSGSTALTFAANQTAAHAAQGVTTRIEVYDITNPSAIPDNTMIVSALTASPFTVTLSAATTADIPSTDVLEYGYIIRGGTSFGMFTVNLNGSNVATSVNIIKPGAGFSAVGSGTMTFSINKLLNEYGSVDAPACSANIGAASFTGSYTGGNVTATGVTGALAVGQVVVDSTGATAVVTGNPSGGVWAVNAALTNGAMTANAPVCWYVSTPTKKAYEGFGPYIDNVSGAADPWERARFTIEEWTGPTGPYMAKVTITSDNAIWKPNNGYPMYTYDADMMNGSTEIMGAASGGAGNIWAGISQKGMGSWTTLDPCTSCVTGASGRPIWIPLSGGYSSANSQALAQVIIEPTPADAVFIHGDHSAPPLDNRVTPSPTVVTTSTGQWGQLTYPNLYAPFEHGGTDATVSFDSGGDTHPGLGPLGSLHASWYLCTANSCPDHGASYLQNQRVAADVLPGIGQGPRYDATDLPVNVFNTSVWTPPAAFTDPPAPSYAVMAGLAYYYYENPSQQPVWMYIGLTQPVYEGHDIANESVETNYSTIDHYPELIRGAYLAEAERYLLDDWIGTSEMVQANRYMLIPTGGPEYDGQILQAHSHRQNAWDMNVVGPLAYLGPPNEPAIHYFKQIVASSYAGAYAFYSYVGTGTVSGVAFHKYWDNTANGQPTGATEYTSPPSFGTTTEEFMDYYWSMDTDDMAMLDNCADANLCGFAHAFLDNYAVKNNSVNCPYNAIDYVVQWAQDPATHTPQPGWNATDPSNPQRGNGPTYLGYSTVHTEAGSSIITASLSTIPARGAMIPTATSAVSPGGTTIPLSSVTSLNHGNISTGWVIKDITNPTALTYPTYVTAPASGLTIPISPPVTGPGISSGDTIAVSGQWQWTYPVTSTTRLPTDSRIKIANLDWVTAESPSDGSDGITTFPVPSTPQVTEDGSFGYLCMDASGAAIGQYSTTPCASPNYVVWGQTGDWSMAYVANAACPTTESWRDNVGSEYIEMWPTANWRKALNGVLGTSTDATTAISNLSPYFPNVNATYASRPTWAGADHF